MKNLGAPAVHPNFSFINTRKSESTTSRRRKKLRPISLSYHEFTIHSIHLEKIPLINADQHNRSIYRVTIRAKRNLRSHPLEGPIARNLRQGLLQIASRNRGISCQRYATSIEQDCRCIIQLHSRAIGTIKSIWRGGM